MPGFLDNIDFEGLAKKIPFLSDIARQQQDKPKVIDLKGSESFQAQLPYFSYDFDKGIYVNKSCVGIGFKISGVLGASHESVKLLLNLLQKLSPDREDLYLQFIRYSNHEFYDRLLAVEQDASLQGGMYEAFAKYNTKFLINMAKNGLKTKAGYNLSLYDTSCYVFLSTPYKQSNLDEKIELLDLLKKEALSDSMFKDLEINDFLSLVQSVVNPYPGRIQKPEPYYDELRPLAEQICKTDYTLQQENNKLKVSFLEHPNHYPNKVRTELVSMNIETFPKYFSLWNIPECFASIRNQHLGIKCPHLFSITFKFQPKFETKEKAGQMVRSLEKYTNPSYAKFVYNKREEYADWKAMQDFLEQSDIDIRLADVHTSLLLFTNSKMRQSHIRSTQDIFTTAGFLISPKDGAHLFQLMSSLPFTAAEGYFSDSKKLSMQGTITNWNIANLLPIVNDWRGSYTGLVIPSPRNQFVAFDLFNQSLPLENTNMILAASPGSGKSFLMQAIIRDILSRAGKVWIFDRGNSYKKTCDLLGGVYINKDSLNLNPFTFLPEDKEDAEVLNFALVGVRDLLACMASPDDSIEPEEQQYLMNAVLKVYEKTGRDSNIDHVHAELLLMYEEQKGSDSDRRIFDLALKLQRYTSTQMYGKYFNKGSLLDPKQNLIVVELGEFDSTPDLQKAILCALIMHVGEEMYQTGRDRPKMCIIEEAWAFLNGNNPIVARFTETGFRTSRKHRGSFVVVTQDFDVFFDDNQPLAKVAYNCSAVRLIMRQNKDRFRQFCNKNDGIFNSYEQAVIEGFQEAKQAGFSSFCMKTDAFTSFHRLIVDPVSRVMFSTEPTQYQAVENLITQGRSTFDAVYEIAKRDYPDEMQIYGEMQ